MQLKVRSEIEKKHLWTIDDMFPTQETFDGQFMVAKELMQQLESYKGRVLESQESLKGLLQVGEKLNRLVEDLFTFSHMKKDEDNNISFNQSQFDKAMSLSVEVGSVSSFIEPELLLGEQGQVMSLLQGDDFLEQYTFYLNKLFRQKAHKLSEKEEKIIAMNGEVSAAPQLIFGMLNNADLKFPVIQDEVGTDVQLTNGNFIPLLQSKDQKVRKEAFEAFYSSFIAVKNTIAATYISSVKNDIFHSKVRQYDSVLKWGLDDERIDQSVYENLIKAVHAKMPLMHRYMKLRKKMLGIEEQHIYDVHVPLGIEDKQVIAYEEGVEMVLEGLSALGKSYMDIMTDGLQNGWVDVYETPGKTSGAYSWGTYDSKPYILLNYQDNLDYVFTLAHELGHSMHCYLAGKNQSYPNARYTIFVAEVASTVNEALLMKSLLKKTHEKQARMTLINYFMDQFKSTVYRQTMFAEFEKWSHEQIEAGIPLTQEDLSAYYYELVKLYFGEDVIFDDAIRYEWMRIPHFYNAFYVYKYATGFSAAMAITERIEKEGDVAVSEYLSFLSAGGSDYPIELLKIAGVDMTTPEPIERGLDIFEQLLNEMEQLIES
jgi:oligoendopeptidase F